MLRDGGHRSSDLASLSCLNEQVGQVLAPFLYAYAAVLSFLVSLVTGGKIETAFGCLPGVRVVRSALILAHASKVRDINSHKKCQAHVVGTRSIFG